MSYPLIGLTSHESKDGRDYPTFAVFQSYIEALIQAGAAPLMIPLGLPDDVRLEIFQHLDGILFPGGGDISLEFVQGEDHPSIHGVSKLRDELELELVREAVSSAKPFFGICRGFQVINVALGGTLYTHLPDQRPGGIDHDQCAPPRERLAHPIRVESGSLLADILQETDLEVNSRHHQGARDLPASLKAVAFSPDGLVEAVELPGHPFGLAVQWHPENLTANPAIRRLFKAFVDAAGKGK
jgi:putative glutamine amidotransferase